MLVNFSQVLTLPTTIIDSQLTSRNCLTSQPIPINSQLGNHKHYFNQPRSSGFRNGRFKNVNLSVLTPVQENFLKFSSPPLITFYFYVLQKTILVRPQQHGTACTLIIVTL